MQRPEVNVFLAISLDGFIADRDGQLGWLTPFGGDSPDDTGYTALMQRVDVLVMGRNTYETVLAFGEWPYVGKRVLVLSHRPLADARVEPFSGPIDALLAQLCEQGCRAVYLDGGAVVRQALQAALIDRMTLSWAPVLLGQGKPLFGPELPMTNLDLLEHRLLPSGLLQCTYQPKERAPAPDAPAPAPTSGP